MELSTLANTIVQQIHHHGGHCYVVGGKVRDELLNIESHDIDIEVFHLTEERLFEILSLYGHVRTIGKSFAIMSLDNLPGYDFALPRMERKTGDKHVDFEVTAFPDLPLEKAVLRRDLTMNALMYDLKNHTLIDLVDGKQHLMDNTIHCVNESTFIEDPLRVLRVASFVARFGMEVDAKTVDLCKGMVKKGMLTHLPLERIKTEYDKILMSDNPALGFYFLKEIEALPDYLEVLCHTHQRLDYHPEGDVFTHTMMVLDCATQCRDKTSNPLMFMWGCLLHDIGKPAVTDDFGHAPNHEGVGADLFKNHIHIIDSKKDRKYVECLIRNHMTLMNYTRNGVKDYKYYLFLKRLEGVMTIDDLMYITSCDKLGRGSFHYQSYHAFWEYMADMIHRLGKSAPVAIVKGDDLNQLNISKEKMKDALYDAYVMQLQGNDKSKILRGIQRKYVEG